MTIQRQPETNNRNGESLSATTPGEMKFGTVTGFMRMCDGVLINSSGPRGRAAVIVRRCI